MQKEPKPKFFCLNIIEIGFGIISFFALFNFWNKLSDFKKVVYIGIPIMCILFLINVYKYHKSINIFYKKYETLYENNEALTNNYKNNRNLLKQETNYNQIISNFIQNVIQILYVYNDLTNEQKITIKKKLWKIF